MRLNMKLLKLNNSNELRLPTLKKVLQVISTTTLALTVGIFTELEVKGQTSVPIPTDDMINLIVNGEQINQQYSLSDMGDIDFYSILFSTSGNFNMIAKEMDVPTNVPTNNASFLSDNLLSLYLFDENEIFIESGTNLDIEVDENSNYLLALNTGIDPILDNDDKLTDWDFQPPYPQGLVSYDFSISANTIPEPSTLLGLILFGFAGVIKGGKKN